MSEYTPTDAECIAFWHAFEDAADETNIENIRAALSAARAVRNGASHERNRRTTLPLARGVVPRPHDAGRRMSRLDGHPEAERLRGDQSRRADGTGEEDRFMVNVNPLEKKHGLIVLENEVGHQQWALIVDAEVEYDNDVSISSSDAAQYSVTTTLAPGEMLRMASTFNPYEENVLVYSRLLVSVLREERERYAALEKRFHEQGVQLRKAREENGTAEREHAGARKACRPCRRLATAAAREALDGVAARFEAMGGGADQADQWAWEWHAQDEVETYRDTHYPIAEEATP